MGTARQYPGPGRVLMQEGEQSTFVLVLLDGVVKATGRTEDGAEVLLAVRMGGDLVGEFAAADGRPRSATVTTCGAVVAHVIKRDDFLACLQRDPRLAQAVSRSVVGKLRAANSRRIDFTGCDAPTRLARVLHELAVTYGERADGRAVLLRWPLTQPELASLASVAEPTAHKALRRMRADGIVETGYRKITILNLAWLHRDAYP